MSCLSPVSMPARLFPAFIASCRKDLAHGSGRAKPNLNLHVEMLPPKCDDPAFVKQLNDAPGILALAMERKTDANGKTKLEALPFIVPGARFNEKYGWDSVSLEVSSPAHASTSWRLVFSSMARLTLP
jgi:hypothetical protein